MVAVVVVGDLLQCNYEFGCGGVVLIRIDVSNYVNTYYMHITKFLKLVKLLCNPLALITWYIIYYVFDWF